MVLPTSIKYREPRQTSFATAPYIYFIVTRDIDKVSQHFNLHYSVFWRKLWVLLEQGSGASC